MSDKEQEKKDKEENKPVIVKNATDLQRLRLAKLMANPEKSVAIPERRKEKTLAAPPDFVRNVMGSSAGAGSGEFHVYRHLRRKEYARQKFIQEKSEKEQLDDDYHSKIQENKRQAEEKTARKRAKRLKKKQKAKNQKTNKIIQKPQSSSDSDNENSECDIVNENVEDEREEKDKSLT